MQYATATTITDELVKRFICVFGPPKAILTDQGPNFLSGLMKRVAARFRIKKVQSNGSLERSHHVLGEYLKQYVGKKFDWDEWVELAVFNYNTSVTTTLHELVYGKISRTPSCEPLMDDTRLTTYGDYMIKLVKTSYMRFKEQREIIYLRSKEYYDRKANPKNFVVVDYVFLQKGRKRKKLVDYWIGPHKILELFPNENVHIEVGKSLRWCIRTGFQDISQINLYDNVYINDL